MKLTGKAKEDFEKWLKDKRHFVISVEEDFQAIWFNCSDSMKYGVYVDWFDSVAIEIYIRFYRENDFKFEIYKRFVRMSDKSPYNTRPEARTAAIEKANKIYNAPK